MDGELNLIEMELREIQLKNDSLQAQVVVLAEKDGPREFPIYIGTPEAMALDATLHNRSHQRPLTHDLISNVIEGVGARLTRILVDDLRDDIFYGKLVVRTVQNTEELIDSRPSDAIVMATKFGVPIFVSEEVLERAGRHHEE